MPRFSYVLTLINAQTESTFAEPSGSLEADTLRVAIANVFSQVEGEPDVMYFRISSKSKSRPESLVIEPGSAVPMSDFCVYVQCLLDVSDDNLRFEYSPASSVESPESPSQGV